MEVKVSTDKIMILEDFFQGLSDFDQRKIFLRAFRRASRPLVNAAKINVPKKTRTLERSIGIRDVPQEIAILVGARSGPYGGRHGHLVESGTKERFRKSGASTGRMPASHFFEMAYSTTEGQVYGTIEDEWYNEINRYVIKYSKL